jgi:hypothetical protein
VIGSCSKDAGGLKCEHQRELCHFVQLRLLFCFLSKVGIDVLWHTMCSQMYLFRDTADTKMSWVWVPLDKAFPKAKPNMFVIGFTNISD